MTSSSVSGLFLRVINVCSGIKNLFFIRLANWMGSPEALAFSTVSKVMIFAGRWEASKAKKS